MFEKKIEDKELGTILLIAGPRYKRYALRVKDGVVRATMPLAGDEKQMMAFIEANRAKLAELVRKQPSRPPLIDEQTTLTTASFRLELIPAVRKDIGVSLAKGVLSVQYPQHIPVCDERIQNKLYEILKNVFRHEAKRLLPDRVEELARQYGFTYTGVSINSARTRWGSCSSRKHLNLSLYLMQLPWHLIDYVILHELCHTCEMNHGDRFWALMDRVTDGRSKILRKELKALSPL
ncbi:SprT family zinc-dependent metalloprotease [Parabacteroides sp. PF5-6]|uniref:M48 family metallopeptidase n=1 Tax=Parabacteroides sp. PF5-6 TaxID=1742403 RepID=UPI002405D93C|nr:SprT family zinc-dependent metalloprotease [Parabacteroides sp. PF5-6]MDF9829995.1 putative metal-dependent hydrolase [Parabacteroides sp. PF5-6]